MNTAQGQLTRSRNYHDKFYFQSLYAQPVEAPTQSETAEGYMRFNANLQTLLRLDRSAYDRMIAQLDQFGQPWQSVDVDVCNELARLEELSERDEITSMRNQ
jgi:hypothetical protein